MCIISLHGCTITKLNSKLHMWTLKLQSRCKLIFTKKFVKLEIFGRFANCMVTWRYSQPIKISRNSWSRLRRWGFLIRWRVFRKYPDASVQYVLNKDYCYVYAELCFRYHTRVRYICNNIYLESVNILILYIFHIYSLVYYTRITIR